MRQMYIESWSEKVDASHSKYVFSDRIQSGYVLRVLNCYVSAPECETNDVCYIGVRSGGKDFLIRKRKCRLDNVGLSALNPFLVGEGDQVFAYFPNADNTDTIELHVNGYLLPAKEWREQGG